MGFFSDRFDDFKSGVREGFITLLPGGTVYLMWDTLGNVELVNAGTPEALTGQDVLIQETADRTADALGIPDLELETLLNRFGELLGEAASVLGNATLEVIEGAGVALVNGVDRAYDYIRLKLRGKEPDVIAGLTVGLLTILTGTYLVYAARRGTMKFSE
jgi:hypothetical protein